MERIIVVGSGFSGSIIARMIAEKMNKKVIVVERRNHIGGNAYDEYDENGILIQRYGPHFINTDNYSVIEFLMQYSKLFRHDTKLLSYIDEQYVRLPFNFRTMQQLVGDKKSEYLLKQMRAEFAGRDRVAIFELLKSNDDAIREYGNLLFEKAYKTYTAKQWGLNPDQIDKSVLERVPMAMNYDERYLNKDFQYLPINGFTKLFENMLNHKNIEVRLNCDAFDHISFDYEAKKIKYDNKDVDLLIFTGAIDELFSLKYGRLPYRSLNIKYDYYDEEEVLPCEIVSYPQAPGYTRQTEYKQIAFERPVCNKTVVATEYPVEYTPDLETGNIPYYPVLTSESKCIYEQYVKEAESFGNIVLCGRLAEFKYYNMDVCIEHALEKFNEIKLLLEE
ncbi:MAG: UDP-galactopyranose mutase [Ruminiclostridium sp.]|nr:UDP-galactopyranose mutase [Ruminiclostridium sp.]